MVTILQHKQYNVERLQKDVEHTHSAKAGSIALTEGQRTQAILSSCRRSTVK